MLPSRLIDFVEKTSKDFNVPGVAVGVWLDGKQFYACQGITSIDNPLPIDQNTLFLLGSVTKTFTATTLMCLVAAGKVELNAPVSRYVPELRLKDRQAEDTITILNLLNHTAGLDWGVIADTGEGDDALARYVAKMAELEQIAAPGMRASYSQAGYNLIGRVIEHVTGQSFDQAVTSLVLEPLGLSQSFFSRDDIMTRRFAVGHNPGRDGTLSVARLWRRWRGDNPGGGLASSIADQIRWARFHLGDGRAASGEQVLPANILQQMKEPTTSLRGSVLGDAIGICWFVRDIDGVRTIGHGGSANGQFADLLLVPERNFAVVSLSNAGPDGIPFNKAVIRWALEYYIGLSEHDPEPIPFDAVRAQEVVGQYETHAQRIIIRTDGAKLTLEAGIKTEIRAASNSEMPPDYPPADMGLLPGNKDEYIITSGGLEGQRGFFTRDKSGVVEGVDLAGRLFSRASSTSA